MARVDVAIADEKQWQGIDSDVLHIILEGTYRSFVDMMGYELDKDIVVTNDLNSQTPMIFFPLNTREERESYHITLKVEDTRNWGEIVYQLSHEICHAYCNFYKAKATKHKWFEEAICEAGAFSNLNNIYQTWNDLPFAAHPALETFLKVATVEGGRQAGMLPGMYGGREPIYISRIPSEAATGRTSSPPCFAQLLIKLTKFLSVVASHWLKCSTDRQ